MYFFVALVTACIFGVARTQELFKGPCPTVATKSGFNITRVMYIFFLSPFRLYDMQRIVHYNVSYGWQLYYLTFRLL